MADVAEPTKPTPVKPKRVAAPGKKLGRSCTVCQHPDISKINAAIVKGDTTDSIVAITGLNKQAVARHRQLHVPMALPVVPVQAAEAAGGISLLEQASGLIGDARAILVKAEKAGQLDTALRAIREVARLLDLSARLTGQIDTSTTVNVTLAPVMVSLQTEIMRALANHPEARRDVIAALSRMSGGPMIEGNVTT